jgi:squalene synthase HpnC
MPEGLPQTDAVLSQAGHENFPVALRLLPRRTRSYLMAIYGFARLVDDIGDEAEGDRSAMLDWLEGELERAASGTASHPLMQRLHPAFAELGLPQEPFRHLIEANRQDQAITRYETFNDLYRYCELSAAPVGRLVLAVFGASTAEREALSDDVCIALQVVEHLQDIGEDAARGRIYMPAEDRRRFGVQEDDLHSAKSSSDLCALVAFESERARHLLCSGVPLARDLPGRAGVAVAAFTAGGRAALDAIERAEYDVLSTLCRPGKARTAWRMAGVLAGRDHPRSAS